MRRDIISAAFHDEQSGILLGRFFFLHLLLLDDLWYSAARGCDDGISCLERDDACLVFSSMHGCSAVVVVANGIFSL